MIPRLSRAYLAPCASLALLAVTAYAGGAQQRPRAAPDLARRVVSVKFDKAAFSDILATITQQVGCNILVDGQPIRATASFAFDGAASSCLDRVSDEFDLTWTISRSGIILMQKRFHDPHELPQVPVGEMRETARDILRLMRGIPGADRGDLQDPLFKTLGASLTPDQKARLLKPEAVPITDLFPAQRSIVYEAIVNIVCAHTYRAWRRLSEELDGLPRSFVTRARFGAEGPMPSSRITVEALQLGRLAPNGRPYLTELFGHELNGGSKP